MRILIVEDEQKVASFTARSLREEAYAVDVAESGEQALEMVDGTTYEVILLTFDYLVSMESRYVRRCGTRESKRLY